MNPQYLNNVILGCLNQQTVKNSQAQLLNLQAQPGFLRTCLTLIPNQKPHALMMILTTIKNYLKDHYLTPNYIPLQQKQILKQNALNFYYALNQNHNAIQIYHQILKILIKNDFTNWNQLVDILQNDLKGQALASIHFIYSAAKYFEFIVQHQKRQPFQTFMQRFFCYLQNFTESCLTEYIKQKADILRYILQTVFSYMHNNIGPYFRNFQVLGKWILYFNTVMKADFGLQPQNPKIVCKIYRSLFKYYSHQNNEGKQYKGWAGIFRQKFATNLYEQLMNFYGMGDQQCKTLIVRAFEAVISNPKTSILMSQDQCQTIVYKGIIPAIQFKTNQQCQCFFQDPKQYIQKQQSEVQYIYRRSSIDLLKQIFNLSYNGKKQIVRFMEYSSTVLESNNSSDNLKQAIIKIYANLFNTFKRNQNFKRNFQTFTQRCFIPILKQNKKPILIYHTYRALKQLIQPEKISNNFSRQLAGLTYGHILSEHLAVKFSSMLLFSRILDNQQAFQIAKPHFEAIIKIYVEVLDHFDHEKLYQCLQDVADTFKNEIPSYSNALIQRLVNNFYTQAKKNNEDEDDQDDQNDNKSAIATLETIKQILKAPLSEQHYWNITDKILALCFDMLSMIDQYSKQILDILNIFVYKSKRISNYQFPYLLCRIILQGNTQILKDSNLENETLNELAKCKMADLQYGQTLISIIKNLVQKMPDQILHKFKYPTHPQIFLSLIENKRLSPQYIINNIKPTNFSQQWSPIIMSYIAQVYGIGQVCDPWNFKNITGLSLYPWIKSKFCPNVIEKLLATQSQSEDQDIQENTMMMLQKYGNQDDDGDANSDYNDNSGVNYSFNYLSPFDSANDMKFMIQRLHNLQQSEAQNFRMNLNEKYKKKLDNLLMNM